MAIHHYMVHVPVNTSGNERMVDGVRRRLQEISEMNDIELCNIVHIYEPAKVR